MRKMKNVVNNYTPAQIKVREATSNDPWGPSSSVMSEIADLTYNVVAFSEIMSMVWKRLNDHGKNWRHVYKALMLLEYIIKTGSERVAQQCKENIFAIQTLKDFQFADKDNKDQGMNVREKSKNLVMLLKDDDRLKTERERALKAKERFAQASQGIGSDKPLGETTDADAAAAAVPAATGTSTQNGTSSGTPPIQRDPSSEIEQARPQTTGEEELQLQLALAMSREEADEKKKMERSDDVRLQMALSVSATDDEPITTPYQQQQQQQQQPSTLLNLAEPNQQISPAKADPWGMPTAAPPVSDPWGASTSPVSDPGAASMPAIPHDPWGSQPNPAVPPPAPVVDPWAPTPQAAGPAPDPWGVPPSTANVAPAPAPDPWGPSPATASDPWGATTRPSDPDAEFDQLRTASPSNMNAAFGSPLNQQHPAHSGDAFNMSGMSGALDQNQQQKKKSPKDFLGENSSLVNLDSLIAPAPQPTPAPANPFLGSATTNTGTATQANPFHQQRTPAPTINQIRSQPASTMSMGGGMQTGMGMGGGLMGGTSLPQPLMPMNNTPLIPQSQPPQQQTNNPFLM